jgi:hypothetical protein
MKMHNKNETEEEHVKKCFRCRLHALVEELYPKGIPDQKEGRFILIALAEAAGQLLADNEFEEEDFYHFLSAIAKFHNDRVDEEIDSNETKH